MYYLLSVLILITCILLILIVLVQNSKGGGLASNFASSNQVLGARKTTDFLEKATWTLAIALLAFSLIASLTIPRTEEEKEQRSLIEDKAISIPDETPANTWAPPPPPGDEQPPLN
jgi:preprotein translocase subunit SecG